MGSKRLCSRNGPKEIVFRCNFTFSHSTNFGGVQRGGGHAKEMA